MKVDLGDPLNSATLHKAVRATKLGITWNKVYAIYSVIAGH